MHKRALHSLSLAHAVPWLPVAMNLWEMSIVAPQVVALRSARMLNGGLFPSARDQREFLRMFEEKSEAFVESMTAMSLEWLAMNQALAAPFLGLVGHGAFGPWGLHASRRRRSLPRLVAAGMAPLHRRVKANALRLARSRA
jgi:hypothetical protein